MVKNKILGIILILIALIFLSSIIIFKMQISKLITVLQLESGGECIKDGVCIHEQSNLPVYIGVGIVFLTLSLGLYLIFFEKSQEYIEKTQKELISTLHETKKKQDEDEKFNFLLKALNEDEKKIIKSVKEQDGIEQSTLRIRTDLSKAKLSVVLSELEKKNLIKKVPIGKKNRIYIKTPF